MPRVKERKGKAKGTPPPVVLSLQKFLRTYEKHCAGSQTPVCPAIRRDLRSSIANEQSLRTSSLLELTGCTACPFTTLEIIDCKMDSWSLGRLGKALQLGGLHSLALDYCRFGNEEMEYIFSGLANNKKLQGLSLRYCGLGPGSGPRLGFVISQSAICELYLDGNDLQCSGALALLRPLVEFTEMQGKDPPAPGVAPNAGSPPQLLHTIQKGSSSLSQNAKSSQAATVTTTSGKKKRKKEIKKRKCLAEPGPWLVKLHLADNGIDSKGEEGSLLEFTRMLTCLITRSAHVREIDLGNNVLGEKAAAAVLGALRARKTGSTPSALMRHPPARCTRSRTLYFAQ
ncbi:uncharacterized protein LOC111816206 isoform X2 [Octodon degus]|uniref:Uncharacterized protein LOC111816206 isoform X2 n=1 Tax=Octodon degus TaxID=10160 RepID=A0A6P6E9M6_OCTDE|nr:uncharacterized protein LOC111816206 isoform X2 [Octodon degus]